jgi:hypothetical protein
VVLFGKVQRGVLGRNAKIGTKLRGSGFFRGWRNQNDCEDARLKK